MNNIWEMLKWYIAIIAQRYNNVNRIFEKEDKMELMEREADYKTLIKLADYFDVFIDYLLGREENKK